MSYVVCCSKLWNPLISKVLEEKSGKKFHLITNKDELTVENLNKLKPDRVFFPHWSHILPAEIYQNFECIMFHMTDLPYGRGGSPLQNLIVRGHQRTKISAFRCDGGIDTGPIYLKKDLSLNGTAQEIFQRATSVVEDMILEIIDSNPIPMVQQGESVEFKRRRPEDGNLEHTENVQQAYDFIRMLDAEGYSPAFLKLKNMNLSFQKARWDGSRLMAEVEISPNEISNEKKTHS